MTTRETFHYHKGKEVKVGNTEGIIIGFNPDFDYLIAKTTNCFGWEDLMSSDKVEEESEKGYVYCEKKHIKTC